MSYSVRVNVTNYSLIRGFDAPKVDLSSELSYVNWRKANNIQLGKALCLSDVVSEVIRWYQIRSAQKYLDFPKKKAFGGGGSKAYLKI